MLQLLGPEGTRTAAAANHPVLSDDQLLRAYRAMIQARAADEWAVSLNRQGRLLPYPPSTGQEANSVGSVMALRDDDWIVQAYREIGGLLLRGVPLEKIYLYWYGNEWGSELAPEKYHVTPTSIVIGSHLPHAVGVAFAERYQKRDRVVLAFLGDGATSEGDFHEALNFAGVWKTPNVFYVQNNQYAISTPVASQTASKTFAEKAAAYGFEGVRVDGNDVIAVYAVTKAAVEKARSGGGPTLIEGVTYRVGAHTTTDDPRRYRGREEELEWEQRDPIRRLQRLLTKRALIGPKDTSAFVDEARHTARETFDRVEKMAAPTVEETFSYTYKDPPAQFRKQQKLREELDRDQPDGGAGQ